MGVNFKEANITKKDIFTLSGDELVAKFGSETTYFQKVIIRQYAKFTKNINGATTYIIGNMLWGIILLTFINAFFLKLLYIRHRSYYVEHVLQMTHINSIALILFSILIVIHYFLGHFTTYLLFVIIAWVNIYAFLSFKHYYKDNFIKALMKFGLLSSFNIMLMTFILQIISSLSFFIF